MPGFTSLWQWGQASTDWVTLTLIVLCLGTFAVLLDATIVNVALPSVITGLHASLDQALWSSAPAC